MRKKFYLAALLVITVVSVCGVASHRQLLKKPSTLSGCPADMAVTVADRSTQRLHAAKVVVKPWEGRHNVYGMFIIPADTMPQKFFTFKIDGKPAYCGRFHYASPEESAGIVTQPGERVVIGYLRTRTTMWLMSQGKKMDLKQPQNWSLPLEKDGTGS